MANQVVYIGNTDENADWIRTLPSYADEVALLEQLAQEEGIESQEDKGKNETT